MFQRNTRRPARDGACCFWRLGRRRYRSGSLPGGDHTTMVCHPGPSRRYSGRTRQLGR